MLLLNNLPNIIELNTFTMVFNNSDVERESIFSPNIPLLEKCFILGIIKLPINIFNFDIKR